MRAVIYRRVSTQAQVTSGASLSEQDEACRAYADRMGWTVITDYLEAGRSAYAEDVGKRPALQQLLADAKRRQFEIVIVHDLSRLARRQRVAFSVGHDLERLGVRVASVTEWFDTGTVEGFIAFSMLTMQAELHSRLLSRRMSGVRAREAAQGRMMTKPPVGYRWEDKAVVVDEERAPLVRTLFHLAGDLELSGPEIQLRLAAQGTRLDRSAVQRILTNVAYTGRLFHRGKVLPAVWPAIISRELFDKVQAVRSARSPRNQVRSVVRTRRPALFAGLLFCDACGAKMYFDAHPHGPTSYYRCGTQWHRAERGTCTAVSCRERDMSVQVESLVTALTLPDDLIAEVLARVTQKADARPPVDEPAVRERLRRLARAYADGAYSDAEYTAQRAALEAQLSPRTPTPAVDLNVGAALLRDMPRLWGAAADANARRKVLGSLFARLHAAAHQITAVAPTTAAAPFLVALWPVVMERFWSQKGHSPITLIASS